MHTYLNRDDHDSDDNLTDEDERPLSKEEIKARTLKGVRLSF